MSGRSPRLRRSCSSTRSDRKQRIDGVFREPWLSAIQSESSLSPRLPVTVGKGHGDDRTLTAALRDQPAHHVRVPDGVQVHGPVGRIVALSKEGHLHPVSAAVAPVGRVQRLVDVAVRCTIHLSASFLSRRLASRRRGSRGDGRVRGSASAVAAVFLVGRSFAERRVVVVPGRAPLAPVGVLDLVGPVRDFAERAPDGRLTVSETVVPAARGRGRSLSGSDSGRDFPDHAVSFRAPRERGLREREEGAAPRRCAASARGGHQVTAA